MSDAVNDGSGTSLYGTCLQEFQDEINRFNLVVILSLGLTAANILLYHVVLQSKFASSPQTAAKFFYITGSIKVLIGLSLWTFLLPTCPNNCDTYCGGVQPHTFYPMIAVIIGIVWIKRGYKHAQAGEGGEGQGGYDMPEMSTSPTKTTSGGIV